MNPGVASADTLKVRFIRRGITGVDALKAISRVYAHEQNYPNPFNPTTTIRYALPRESSVSLKVYSILGEEVVTLVDEIQGARNYTVNWNATSSTGQHLAIGVYFYRLVADPIGGGAQAFVLMKKMMFLK